MSTRELDITRKKETMFISFYIDLKCENQNWQLLLLSSNCSCRWFNRIKDSYLSWQSNWICVPILPLLRWQQKYLKLSWFGDALLLWDHSNVCFSTKIPTERKCCLLSVYRRRPVKMQYSVEYKPFLIRVKLPSPHQITSYFTRLIFSFDMCVYK